MDAEDEAWKFKALLVVALIFVVSAFLSYVELKYMMAGRTTDATVEKVAEYASRRGGYRTVYYNYRDPAGNLRHGSDTLGRFDDAPETGDTVVIDHLDDASRLHGHRQGGALMIFFGSLFALVVGGVLFWRHIEQAVKPTSRKYTVPKRF
jgi:hypothetical protein